MVWAEQVGGEDGGGGGEQEVGRGTRERGRQGFQGHLLFPLFPAPFLWEEHWGALL